jgi:hypothetical protein
MVVPIYTDTRTHASTHTQHTSNTTQALTHTSGDSDDEIEMNEMRYEKENEDIQTP